MIGPIGLTPRPALDPAATKTFPSALLTPLHRMHDALGRAERDVAKAHAAVVHALDATAAHERTLADVVTEKRAERRHKHAERVRSSLVAADRVATEVRNDTVRETKKAHRNEILRTAAYADPDRYNSVRMVASSRPQDLPSLARDAVATGDLTTMSAVASLTHDAPDHIAEQVGRIMDGFFRPLESYAQAAAEWVTGALYAVRLTAAQAGPEPKVLDPLELLNAAHDAQHVAATLFTSDAPDLPLPSLEAPTVALIGNPAELLRIANEPAAA